ncbi:MAG TPA: anhydro-N-acetylmuramic acid kinase [Longimicrobiales bacterium]|nr:anhydro-N-acetylmuramic acid kinase [Longimicrobiales bacterium]
MLIVGLMSGTSLDGVDAALVEIDGPADRPVWRMHAYVDMPYSPEQRHALHEGMTSGDAAALCRLHADLGEWFAEAVLRVCRAAAVDTADVTAVGSHGQTIWHEPPAAGRRGATLQLGCAATIAERTGIDVISDFRTRDVAAGGEGAPLVPWVDRLLFAHDVHARVLQNIGGMANLTLVPPRGRAAPLLAFDTGPGNALIDAAVELASAGDSTFDRDGAWAEAGHVDAALLAELLAQPYFARTPPKSTGRETFGRPLVDALARRVQPEGWSGWADLIATLTELTARSICDAITRWAVPQGVDEVIITGGGAHNRFLVERMRTLLSPIAVHADAAALGVQPGAKEALAFAALAWAHVMGLPGNVPEATGAAGPRVLGSFTPGRTAATARTT